MSIFGALLGDLENDPFMRGHMRRMNSMMDNFFRDPFGDIMGRSMGNELMPFAGAREGRGHELARFDDFGMGFPMMGFPNIGNIFQSMGSNPNCHSFSSSTVMTMTAGPDGRPQVYQASQSVKQGPDGVRETKKSVSDTRTGVKKLAIGHHIHDRAHIIEREQNVFSGEQEERQDFINLDEEEAESFNKEWETRTRQVMRGNAIDYGKSSRRHAPREPQLALPSTASNQNSRHSARSRPHSYYSSSKPSTSALTTARLGEEESESESESEGGEERGGGEKRKLPESGESSSEDDADEPQAKKPMKTPQALPPHSLPK